MNERHYTVNTKDLNFIGSVPPTNKLALTINLSDEEFTTSYFGSYESITLVRNGEKYTFTPDEFISGMNRMAHTARRVSVPRESHVALGHYECGECGKTVDAGDKFCKGCGAMLEDE